MRLPICSKQSRIWSRENLGTCLFLHTSHLTVLADGALMKLHARIRRCPFSSGLSERRRWRNRGRYVESRWADRGLSRETESSPSRRRTVRLDRDGKQPGIPLWLAADCQYRRTEARDGLAKEGKKHQLPKLRPSSRLSAMLWQFSKVKANGRVIEQLSAYRRILQIAGRSCAEERTF